MPRTPENMKAVAARYKTKQEIVNPKAFDEITKIACNVCKADYFRHDHDMYTIERPTQLSRSAPDITRSIFQTQKRASGFPLAPLPRG